jgi:hypothetical protein
MEPSDSIQYTDTQILHLICRDRCGATCTDYTIDNCPENHDHCYHCKERFYPFAIEMFPVKEIEIGGVLYLEVMGVHLLKSKMDEYVKIARHRARTEQYFKDLPLVERKCWESGKMDMLQRKLHWELMASVAPNGIYHGMSRPMIALRAIIENYVDEQVFTKDKKVKRG